MNKQEALEAILTRVRLLEERHTERPLVSVVQATARVRELGALFSKQRGARQLQRSELMEMAALCVHLLRDEVEVVEGRSLDEWLAASDAGLVAREAGLVPVNGAPPRPLPPQVHVMPGAGATALNTALAREAFEAGRRSR